MDYLTTDELRNWVEDQPDDAYYCMDCLTRLAQTNEGLWYCPNEMCLYDEQETIDEDED